MEVVFFKTLTEQNGLDALQMDNEGHALNEDVISSATIRVSYYAEAIQDTLNK